MTTGEAIHGQSTNPLPSTDGVLEAQRWSYTHETKICEVAFPFISFTCVLSPPLTSSYQPLRVALKFRLTDCLCAGRTSPVVGHATQRGYLQHRSALPTVPLECAGRPHYSERSLPPMNDIPERAPATQRLPLQRLFDVATPGGSRLGQVYWVSIEGIGRMFQANNKIRGADATTTP